MTRSRVYAARSNDRCSICWRWGGGDTGFRTVVVVEPADLEPADPPSARTAFPDLTICTRCARRIGAAVDAKPRW